MHSTVIRVVCPFFIDHYNDLAGLRPQPDASISPLLNKSGLSNPALFSPILTLFFLSSRAWKYVIIPPLCGDYY